MILLLTVGANIYAQESWEEANAKIWDEYYNDNALRIIYGGEIGLLDKRLDELNLASLTKKQLRLLRNMIYAKHGYSFKSEDLQNHMKHFDWYKPSDKFYEGLLNDIDVENKENILKYENGDGVSNIRKEDLYGIWQKGMMMMASGWSRRFEFDENKFSFYFSEMNSLKRIIAIHGNYEIKNSRLILYVNKEEVLTGGELGKEYTGAWGYILEGDELEEREVFPEMILSFPLSNMKIDNVRGKEDKYIELGGYPYYKME